MAETPKRKTSMWSRLWYALTFREHPDVAECHNTIVRVRRQMKADIEGARLSVERGKRELRKLERHRSQTETLFGVAAEAPEESNGTHDRTSDATQG